MSLFKDPSGNISSKRVFGLVSLVVAVVTTFTTGDVAQTSIWLASAATVFGIQAATKT